MFLLLFDFLLFLLVFHALLTPDLGVGVPIPEHQTIYEKTAAKLDSVVDPNPLGSETFSRNRIQKKTKIPDPSSSGLEINLK
jgi:hypothetical protein